MASQVFSEQEQAYAWLVQPPGSGTQENALDWLKSIGTGAAQGVATGAAAGPWGALIGGLVGAGLGAAQQALQQNTGPTRPAPVATAPRPSSPPPRPPSTSQAVRQGTVPQPKSQSVNNPSGAAVQQLVQVLPQLLQLVQTIQPLLNASQTQARTTQNTGEGASGVQGSESLAGDPVPDAAFGEAPSNSVEQVIDEVVPEYSTSSETNESTLSDTNRIEDTWSPITKEPELVTPAQARAPSTFSLPFEWLEESVSQTVPRHVARFQW